VQILGEIEVYRNNDAAALAALEEALRIYKITHGATCEATVGIQQHVKSLLSMKQ
jgi:hypothetical protein